MRTLKLILLAIAFQIVITKCSFLERHETLGSVVELPKMNIKRSTHTGTLLKDGRIMLVGGIVEAEGTEINTATTEFFDERENRFTPGPKMTIDRAGHTATLLHDGRVLITGGFTGNSFLRSAEVYDPEINQFKRLGSELSEPRAAHTATLLQDGRVLIVGGVNGGITSNNHIDIYDPVTHTISKLISLLTPRTGHTATLLENGKVLIIGGSRNWRSEVLKSCELYDPAKNTLTYSQPLNIPRNKHCSVLLDDGTVLIAAGSSDAEVIGGRYNSIEIYQPTLNKMNLLKSHLAEKRFKITNAGSKLRNGKVVIAGDGELVEIFDPATSLLFKAKGKLSSSFMYPTVISTANNNILIAGGYDDRMRATNRAWLFSEK